MSWLIWRQHRAQAAVIALAVVLLAALLVITEQHMSSVAQQLGLTSCLNSDHGGCDDLAQTFLARFHTLEVAGVLVLTMPAMVGVFIGAPLVARELEHGTYRLVWTQAITRRRWAAAKLLAVVGGGAIATAVLSQLVQWWFTPLARAGLGRLDPLTFDIQGVVPIGYAAFAIALGVAAGAITRRVLPAMTSTLAGYAAVRIALTTLARPHYQQALTRLRSLPAHAAQTTDWILNSSIIDRLGRTVNTPLETICHQTKPYAGACIRAHGFVEQVLYQPATRFWRFQAIETAIYIALAGALIATAIWWIQRRVD